MTAARARSRVEKMRLDPMGRARLLRNGAKNRSKDYEELALEPLAAAIRRGRCAVTGIRFELGPWPDYLKNPFAPSLDRIDPRFGYRDDNVQVVIWAYNLLKAEMDAGSAKALVLQMAAGIMEASCPEQPKIA